LAISANVLDIPIRPKPGSDAFQKIASQILSARYHIQFFKDFQILRPDPEFGVFILSASGFASVRATAADNVFFGNNLNFQVRSQQMIPYPPEIGDKVLTVPIPLKSLKA